MTTRAHVLAPSEHLMHVAVEVAQDAATFVRAFHGSATAAATKSSPTDVVTQTDIECEQRIRESLRQRCPGSTVVGEELEQHVGANDVGWIVDPIDGTVNFLYGLPVVSVSIAATIADEVVAGAVVDVRSGTTFSAMRGRGAYRDGERVKASRPPALAEALIGTGFSYQADVRFVQASVLQRLLPACRDIRCMGSAALNLCWVGCGLLDGYFERGIKLYDFAAGALVAEEGGAIVSLPDDPATGLTWAAAPAVADELAGIVADI